MRALIRRLAESELDAVHRDVIGVASIARVVTADLLRDVLRDVNAVEALEWLRSRTFAEPLGDGITLHDLVRRAARADLKQQDPERERELRRRIADHLYERAVAGDLLLTVDLAELVETPELRVFYGWEGAVRNRIDGVRDGRPRADRAAAGRQGVRALVGRHPHAVRRRPRARGDRPRLRATTCAASRSR